MGFRGFRRWPLFGCWRRPKLRIIRRETIHCPRTGASVVIDLLMTDTGAPDVVLRCSGNRDCPPSCDQACVKQAEAVLARPDAVIISPSDSGPPEELD